MNAIPSGQLTVFGLDRGLGVSGLGGMGFSVARLSTDSVGTHEITLTHVPAGSRVHIEEQVSGAAISDEIATGTNGTFVTYTKTLPVYSSSSPKNDWRIKVRKASESPYYIPYETLMTATVGSSSIYVSMIQDD